MRIMKNEAFYIWKPNKKAVKDIAPKNRINGKGDLQISWGKDVEATWGIVLSIATEEGEDMD